MLPGLRSVPLEIPPEFPLRKKSPCLEPPWPSPQHASHPNSAPPANLGHSTLPPVRVSPTRSPPPKKSSSGALAPRASELPHPAAQSPPAASTRQERTSPSQAPPRR